MDEWPGVFTSTRKSMADYHRPTSPKHRHGMLSDADTDCSHSTKYWRWYWSTQVLNLEKTEPCEGTNIQTSSKDMTEKIWSTHKGRTADPWWASAVRDLLDKSSTENPAQPTAKKWIQITQPVQRWERSYQSWRKSGWSCCILWNEAPCLSSKWPMDLLAGN